MNRKKVAEKIKEAQSAMKIEERDIVEILAGLVFGGASGYAVEKILDNIIPETGSLPLDILLKIGSLGLSCYVGDKVGEAAGKVAGETYDMVIDLNSMIDEMLDEMFNNSVKEVYCEATVE